MNHKSTVCSWKRSVEVQWYRVEMTDSSDDALWLCRYPHLIVWLHNKTTTLIEKSTTTLLVDTDDVNLLEYRGQTISSIPYWPVRFGWRLWTPDLHPPKQRKRETDPSNRVINCILKTDSDRVKCLSLELLWFWTGETTNEKLAINHCATQ